MHSPGSLAPMRLFFANELATCWWKLSIVFVQTWLVHIISSGRINKKPDYTHICQCTEAYLTATATLWTSSKEAENLVPTNLINLTGSYFRQRSVKLYLEWRSLGFVRPQLGPAGGTTKATCADPSRLLQVPWFIPHPHTLSVHWQTLGFRVPETFLILHLFPLDQMTT